MTMITIAPIRAGMNESRLTRAAVIETTTASNQLLTAGIAISDSSWKRTTRAPAADPRTTPQKEGGEWEACRGRPRQSRCDPALISVDARTARAPGRDDDRYGRSLPVWSSI